MKWSSEIAQQIMLRLVSRIPSGHINPCPVCSNPEWVLSDGFIQIGTQREVPGIVLGGESLPSVAIVCKRCGNTQLINLIVLGLAHLLKPETMPDQVVEPKEQRK